MPCRRHAVLTATLLTLGISTTSAAPDSLPGLWATRIDLGPQVSGELRIVSDPDGLRATIAGTGVRFEPHGDSIQFALPGPRGRFRGAWAPGHGAIDGFWIQPGREDGGAGSYASPLTLRRAGEHVWRGVVAPLDDRFTLYLSIAKGPDDSLVAVFRNPERNSIGGATRFRVIRDGDSLRFYARPDSARPQVRLSGALGGDPPR
jgi:hypothetical protein